MGLALPVKVDGFLSEGIVESCSSFRNSRFSIRGSGSPRPWGDLGFNRHWTIDTEKLEVKSAHGKKVRESSGEGRDATHKVSSAIMNEAAVTDELEVEGKNLLAVGCCSYMCGVVDAQ